VGAAGTTRCFMDPLNVYGDVEGKADTFSVSVTNEIEETTALLYQISMSTGAASDNEMIGQSQAGFLHRRDAKSAPTRCTERARLTPSTPSGL
jgi:hypothetical protein